ncbi:hypothetical protein GIB67_018525 [Kingdonia uniflora]|uniref:Uncharacterized protein n=1 Tax=Kingdonia uniflora TaxID=39325 RepID=A0A7J7LWD9_9MAGN|nr:hypothetical protein GIB67_018525 [Kingdonia uniflora]
MNAKYKSRNAEVITYYNNSSIWRGIQAAEHLESQHMEWVIGNGKKINFWRDCWATDIPLREYINLLAHL